MQSDFLSSLRPALVMTLLFALLLGIIYPLAITGIGQALFPRQANGSLVRDHGRVVGSTVVGQAFSTPRYFHTRPSAAGKGYDGQSSSGSNLGPTSKALVDRVREQVAGYDAAQRGGAIPADMVTASASGLDPDITPEAAYFQVARVAAARNLTPNVVRQLVTDSIDYPLLGVIGERRVNVFNLNRRLDAIGATSPQ